MSTGTQYVINWSDVSEKPNFIIQPGEKNLSTSLTIYGMGAAAYGEGVNENVLHILENFSSDTPPRRPTKGQLWYNSTNAITSSQNGQSEIDVAAIDAGELAGTTVGVLRTNFIASYSPESSPYEDATIPTNYDEMRDRAYEQGWVAVGSTLISTTEPTDTGQLWYDTTENGYPGQTGQLKVHDGVAWQSVSAYYAKLDGTGLPLIGNQIAATDIGLVGNSLANRAIPYGSFTLAGDGLYSAETNVNVLFDSLAANPSGGYKFSVQHGDIYATPTELFSVDNADYTNVTYSAALDQTTTNTVINTGGVNFNYAKLFDVGGTVIRGHVESKEGSTTSNPAEGLFGLIVDATTQSQSQDFGGVLIYTQDDDTLKGFEVASTPPGSPTVPTTVFRINANERTSENDEVAYASGFIRCDKDAVDFTEDKHLVTKEYVDTTATTISGIANIAYPVGSIYMSVLATNPSVLLGTGTWAKYAEGQTIIGQKSSDALFGTSGNNGGSRDAIVVSHNHSASSNNDGNHRHSINGRGIDNSSTTVSGVGVDSYSSHDAFPNTNYAGSHNHSITVNNRGSSGVNQNLPPYITTHIWVRTA